jgi:hypothetical protein
MCGVPPAAPSADGTAAKSLSSADRPRRRMCAGGASHPRAAQLATVLTSPTQNRKALFECGVSAGHGRRRRSTVGTAGAVQQTPCRMLQQTGTRGPLHGCMLSGVCCNIFCPVLSVVCCGVLRCPLHAVRCNVVCSMLRAAGCPLHAAMSPLSVVCSVLYVVKCRLHAVGCMLHGVCCSVFRRPLHVARRTSGVVAPWSVATVAAVPFRHGAGPRLHFVALRPIERGEVRYL